MEDIKDIIENNKYIKFIRQYSKQVQYRQKMSKPKPIIVVDSVRNINFLKSNLEEQDEFMEFIIPKYMFTKAHAHRQPMFIDIKFLEKIFEEIYNELEKKNVERNIKGG
jgi:hypothetical protein